jgi:high-affinity Fe2+/Pb2+ permease
VRDVRPAIGMGLAMAIGLIVTSGFVARSTREVAMVAGGFALGLVAAWLVDGLHRLRARRAQQSAPHGE